MALFRCGSGSSNKIKAAFWQYDPTSFSLDDSVNTFQGQITSIPADFNFTGTVSYGSGYYTLNVKSRNGGHYKWEHVASGAYTSGEVTVGANEDIYNISGAENLSQTRTVIYELD